MQKKINESSTTSINLSIRANTISTSIAASVLLSLPVLSSTYEIIRSADRSLPSSAKDIEALLRYGNTLSRYLNDLAKALTGGMKDVQACLEQATEIYPSYLDGYPWRSPDSFPTGVSSFMGKDTGKAKIALERSIGHFPAFVGDYSSLAEYGAPQGKDWNLFCTSIHTVVTIASDETTTSLWPLCNSLAVSQVMHPLSAHPSSK